MGMGNYSNRRWWEVEVDTSQAYFIVPKDKGEIKKVDELGYKQHLQHALAHPRKDNSFYIIIMGYKTISIRDGRNVVHISDHCLRKTFEKYAKLKMEDKLR